MAFPPDYHRQYSYTAFQQAQGDDSFPGTQVDADFDQVGTSIDEINDFLAGSFTPDGVLKPGKAADTAQIAEYIEQAETSAQASAASAAQAQTQALAANVSASQAATQAQSAATSSTFAAQSASQAAQSAGKIPAPVALAYIRGNSGATAFESRAPSDMRSDLSLVPGTDIQAHSADLDAIAALGTSANQLPYATGAGTWALTSLTAFARTLLSNTGAGTARNTLGAYASAGGDITGLVSQSGAQGVVIGATSAFTVTYANGTFSPLAQAMGTGNVGLSLVRFGATASAPILSLGRSRGTTVGTHGAIQSGDQLGVISGGASDGAAMRDGVRMVYSATGAPTSTGVPSRWDVVSHDGTTATTGIGQDQSGNVTYGGSTSVIVSNARHLTLRSYTAATLPSAATAGQMIYVSDGAGGLRQAVSDGTTWRLANGQDASVAATNAQTGTTYTLVFADAYRTVEMNNASANTLTVPPNSSVAFPIGTTIDVVQTGAGKTTIAPGSGVTINSAGGLLSVGAQWSRVTLRKRATDTWVATGSLIA